MAKKIINVGSSANDGTGDTLRSGAQKINDNFTELYDSLAYSLPPATASQLGGVKVGTGLSINNGVLSATPLPTATTSVLGGIKVDGTTIKISNGVVSTRIIDGGSATSVY